MTLTKLTQADIDANTALSNAKTTIATDEAYLSSTDWYVSRFSETFVAIPDEIKTKRASARTEISDLKTKYSIS